MACMWSKFKRIMCIQQEADKKYKKVFIHTLSEKDTSFSVIAVRCKSEESTGKRKMTAGQVYMLLQGYGIADGRVEKSLSRIEQDVIYDDYYLGGLKGKPHLQISAIVGQNGSGKSSIVEFLMRLVNNFAAATLGEGKRGPAATRLHFIDYVDGELWYAQNGKMYHLTVKNAHVMLTEYINKRQDDNKVVYECEVSRFNNHEDDKQRKVESVIKGIEDDAELKKKYEHFFYTLVSNQSIYAYNTFDFEKECNSAEKELKALGPKDDGEPYTTEELSWLHGIFHKNDGYQTPIVITPFRNEGIIDINNENLLAQERLITLLVLQEDLRIINGHLKVKSLSYSFESDTYYGYNAVKDYLGYKNLTEPGYKKLRDSIVKAWGELLDEDLAKHRDASPYYEQAVDYLVYKTLKVSKQYSGHHSFHQKYSLMTDEYDEKALKDMVEGESIDHSHVTRKVMQALAYIVFGVFDLPVVEDGEGKPTHSQKEIKFDELASTWKEMTSKRSDDIMYMPLWSHLRMCALTVPPFFCFQINVCDMEDETVDIDFETLSSGEKQQIYSISSILYHLDNLNSAKDDKSNQNRICYEHVNVILEEIELYYHPELQQQFVMFLIEGLNQMTLENIKGINVMIVTHSPYVLSDIPNTNVLALKKDQAKPMEGLRTFGANIHDMLKDSFFLQGGSMGYFAQWEVGHLMACMEVYQWASEDGTDLLHLPERFGALERSDAYEFLRRYEYPEPVNGGNEKRFSFDHFKQDFSESSILKRIELFDEPVIKNLLLDEFHRTFPKNDKDYKEAKRSELLRQLKELDGDN